MFPVLVTMSAIDRERGRQIKSYTARFPSIVISGLLHYRTAVRRFAIYPHQRET